jgi:hydroxylamine reductase (hybrid-cluster protein)
MKNLYLGLAEMANQWLRLWHDMPNDPKWRTISRASKQSIPAVVAVYLHVLVDASANANERGRTQSINCEDIASALDIDAEQVESILIAMQGRVLDENHVTGWDRRQPVKEDGAAERARLWREKKRKEKEETERNRTQPNATELQDKDKDKDKDKEESKTIVASVKPDRAKTITAKGLVAMGVPEQIAKDWLAIRKQKRAPLTETALDAVRRESEIAGLSLADAIRVSAERGWQGFKAEWLNKTAHGQPINRQQQIEDANAAVVREIAERERLRRLSEGAGDFIGTGETIIEGEFIHAQ